MNRRRSSWWPKLPVLLAAAALAGACQQPTGDPEGLQTGAAVERTAPEPVARIIFLGDSIAAGYGVAEDDAFPAVAGELLAERGLPVEVVNAGVSGDTTAGGVSRIDWILDGSPDVVVVELGGNDGLRGLSVDEARRNLRTILERIVERGATPVLVAMQIPTNLGPDFTAEFRSIYPELASELDVPFVPDFLDGVGGVADLMQPDGLHPTVEGHRLLAETVADSLEPIVRDIADRSTTAD